MSGLIVDLFAGGGGASTGILLATGRHPDVAVNHDPDAISLHEANHPDTRHYCCDVFEVDPLEATGGRPVDLLWASPDCTHFSKARGSKPVEKKIRSLAWVVLRWASKMKPTVIALENVEEFQDWGPVCSRTNQPIKARKSETFKLWVGHLQALGYRVEWKVLCAADFGAPTIRKRLFLIARRDGQSIRWPKPTHAPRDRARLLGLQPWRAAAEIIEWARPVPSIFGRPKPLADKTQARIAKGIKRFVIEAARPFIVPITHSKGGNQATDSADPLNTITCSKGGEFTLVAPTLTPRYGERAGQEPRVRSVEEPTATIVPDGNGAQLSAAVLTKFRTEDQGRSVEEPMPTVTANGYVKRPGGAAPLGLVEAGMSPFVSTYYGGEQGADRGAPAEEPLRTATADNRHAVAATFLQKMAQNGVGTPVTEPLLAAMAQAPRHYQVAAFMARQFGSTVSGRSFEEPAPTVVTDGAGGKAGVAAVHLSSYYGTGDGADLDKPCPTVVTKDRHAVSAAFMEQANTGVVGHDAREPVSTIVGKGCTQRLVTIDFAGLHPEPGSRRRDVLDFLWKHFGQPTSAEWSDPLSTAAARLKFGLVVLDGTVWQISDIGLRMLTPRELFGAQGFPADYIIDRGADGRTITKTAATSMAGNSVSPPPAAALLAANLPASLAARAAA